MTTRSPGREVDAADREVVARQLGRAPRGLRAVEARCRWGFPAVVSVAPLVPGRRGPEPFPTTFWLTCPALVEDLARAESAGGVAAMETAVAADPALAAGVARDHARAAAERSALLGEEDGAATARAAFAAVLEGTGVGGSRDRAHVKCLHAHYAFHRARGGALGPVIDARWAPAECAAGAVRCGPPPPT